MSLYLYALSLGLHVVVLNLIPSVTVSPPGLNRWVILIMSYGNTSFVAILHDYKKKLFWLWVMAIHPCFVAILHDYKKKKLNDIS